MIELAVYGLNDLSKRFKYFKINISESKTPLQIAKDIQKRILPKMIEETDIAIGEMTETRARAAEVLVAAESIIAASGGLFEHEVRNLRGEQKWQRHKP